MGGYGWACARCTYGMVGCETRRVRTPCTYYVYVCRQHEHQDVWVSVIWVVGGLCLYVACMCCDFCVRMTVYVEIDEELGMWYKQFMWWVCM